jgi:Zn-dependent protease
MALEVVLVLVWSGCVVGASTLLHELGHAWAARAAGWKVVGFRWRWYGIACVADMRGRPERLWKVALGGLVTTALLALVFRAGAMLPEPASALFGFGFALNAMLLFTNLVPLRALDGGQVLAGLKAERVRRSAR